MSKKKVSSSLERTLASSLVSAASESRKADGMAEKAHMALASAERSLESIRSRGGLTDGGEAILADISALMSTLGSVRQELGDVVWKAEKHIKKLG